MSRELLFAQFVEATYARLVAFLVRQVGDREAAADVAQAVYHAAFLRPDFDPSRPDAFGFLRRKARWLVQDHRRRRARDPGRLPAELPDRKGGRPDQLMGLEELRERVWDGVGRLSAPHRAIVVRHLRGMSHGQIAADLGLPVQVVYRRFHQAKAILRHLLSQGGRRLPS